MVKDIFSDFEKLCAALSLVRGVIAYEPMADEPDWAAAGLSLDPEAEILRLPQDKHADPFAYALVCAQRFAGRAVVVLVPGRLFDGTGTRHGRGGGWYDRFLSRIPREWLRVGVADATRVSREILPKQEWDEPMDWVLAYDAIIGKWRAHETGARTSRT